ncbi:RNA-directed DNA polymerase, eukaryota [Tanacetum coccineum]
MGSFRSKEDDLSRISTSIYVTNFPESYSAKELFHVCKQYGHVVDSFIPAKKSKDGKRFGFMRFINVFNVDRLVGNLCTIWVNRLKLHANLACFQRDPLSTKKVPEKKTVEVNRGTFSKSFGIRKEGNSFDSVIKGATRLEEKVEELPPVIVLKDDCLSTKDVSKSLMGRVKVFASLVNLRMALSNEGFADIKIKYMGEFWVLLEFQNKELIQKFRENLSVGSWFSCIKDTSMEFQPNKWIEWVEVEGIPLKLWSGNTFNHIAAKWGDLLDVDDQEDSCFHSKRLCVHTKVVPEFNDDVEEELDDDINSNDDGPLEQVLESGGGDTDDEGDQVNLANEDVKGDNILEEGEINEKEDKSKDPFNIYPILNKLADTGGYDSKSEGSLKYPPGFSPAELNEDNGSGIKEIRQQNDEGNSANIRRKDHISESVCSGKFKSSEVPRDGGLAQKAKKDWVRELCIKNRVNVLALQETKMERMELFCVKSCWGNYAFDFVHSDSVGNSRGILCAWDPNSFHKNSHTVSDYFVIIRGVWLKTGMETLLVVVYAPHDVRDKRTLWDYLVNVCNQWNGEVVMMGDFNEVRIKSDRFGSTFNVHGAEVFNSFIMNAGLEEVPLGGSAFTWCHRSATKMSKLDRFFTSENLLNRCPNISAITLDRYLSDHRPILLRESTFDYGPVPFKFFHQWLEVEGFNKFVIDSWIVAPGDKFNGMRNLMLKLRFMKAKIREWNHEIRINSKAEFHRLKKDLQVMDAELDNGKGSAEVVNKRMEVVNSLHRINKIHASELAQKAKIKWSVEGDENSQFFHGMLNKRRNQMSIRGIMVDGTWIEKPDQVKGEFIKHFRNRFDKPLDNRITIDMCFPKSLTTQQQEELESNVSKEELKRAVWDCRVDKSPGPDGFSFGTKIGGVMSRVEAWKEVVDKVTSRLSKWKMKSLSIGGRLTLLKSVLGSIPIYHMSIYRVPKRVLLVLESIRSHFFNGHDSNSKKASWVKWSSVITSKEKGGLGVASLYALNRALMLKWVWRFFSNKDSFWARVIKAIYGEDGSMGKVACSGIRSCWMNIVNEVNVLKEQGINLFEFMKQKMGDGANTCFWEDNWAEGGILKNKFPRVYALEKNKQVMVSVKMKDPSLDHSMRRKVRGGAEQSQLNALSELLEKVNLVPQADRHIWSLDSSEVYTVASMRKLLDDHRSSLVSSTTRWVKYVPIKVNVFAWKVKMNALPTRFNISRRGIDIESILCPLCDSGAESSNHLFFNCTVARHIFSKIVRWWDVVYKEVNSYAEWLSWLLSLRLTSKLKMMLEGSDVKPRSVGMLG